jgi:hypothetical protein
VVSPTLLFRQRHEPSSIYEHVRQHLRTDGPGLLEGGEELPDEHLASEENGLRWAPGALEGAFSRYAAEPEEEDIRARVDELHRAVVRLADQPGARQRARLRRLLREDDVRSVIDQLLQRLTEFPPRDQDRLYEELKRLLLESGRRSEVKLALAVVGAFGNPDDAKIFRTLARHEEFTLYGAIALANTVEDTTSEWLDLLRHVDGWGKTELAELLLREPTPEICDVLLRHGLSIGNALELAVGCKLHEALVRPDVDDELLEGARRIFDELTWGFEGPEELFDYDHAGAAVERFLEHLVPRAQSLDHFLTAYELGRYAEEAEAHGERRTAVGLDGERRRRIVDLCADVTKRAEWESLARRALNSADEGERSDGIQVAKRLGLPLRDYLIEQIERSPNDSGLWFEYVFGADEATVDVAIELAERVWDLGSIATGPALELFGPPPEDSPHQAFDFVLQELPNHPGKGWPLLRAGLASPVIRQRHMALRAVSRWPGGLDSEREAAVRGCLSDPNDEVREEARKVLAGERLEEPVIELGAGGDE